MSVPRLAAFAVALCALVPANANAVDDFIRASSSKPTPAQCGKLIDRKTISRPPLARYR